MEKENNFSAHASMFMACVIWGLMSPIGKDAMMNGISGVDMVSFRVAGAAILFWILSLFVPSEPLPWKEVIKFIPASIFGIILNQCGFTIGLSITSAGNASIVTTTMPIFAMILSFIILHEPITWKKVSGVALGCFGALMLVFMSATAGDDKVGNIKGDLIVLGAQLSYAFFLSIFNPLVRRHSVVTVNKWSFLFATIIIWSFSFGEVASTPWSSIPAKVWAEIGYVVVFGTFLGYIFIVKAQQKLRPTVVAVYNYVQPIVALSVSVLAGIGVFSPIQAVAIIMVFCGVMLVNKSKSLGRVNVDVKK